MASPLMEEFWDRCFLRVKQASILVSLVCVIEGSCLVIVGRWWLAAMSFLTTALSTAAWVGADRRIRGVADG